MDRLIALVSSPGTAVVVPRSMTPGGFLPSAVTTDPDVDSRTPGCACCALRLDLIAAVERAVFRPRPPARLIVVVDLADPLGSDVVTVVYSLLSDPDLARLVRLDGVLVALDPVSLATRRAVGMPALQFAEIQALSIADRVLVGRADAITSDAGADVDEVLRSAAPYALVLAPALRQVGRADLFGIDAWHGVPRHRDDDGAVLDGLDLPDTVVLRHRGVLEPEAADDFFDRLVTSHAPKILRFQGVVAGRGNNGRTCCHGVRSYAMSHPAAEHGDPGPENVVVVTGWGLDVEMLVDDFRDATTR